MTHLAEKDTCGTCFTSGWYGSRHGSEHRHCECGRPCLACRETAENGLSLPVLCDQRGDKCCGTPACLNADIWTTDPYDEPVYVRSRFADVGHSHSEPVCAYPDCETYLTRSEMATMQARQTRPIPPGEN